MRPMQAHTSEDLSKQAMALGGQLMMRAAAGQQVCTHDSVTRGCSTRRACACSSDI